MLVSMFLRGKNWMKISESVIATISFREETPFKCLHTWDNNSAVGAQFHQGMKGHKDWPRKSRMRKPSTERPTFQKNIQGGI